MYWEYFSDVTLVISFLGKSQHRLKFAFYPIMFIDVSLAFAILNISGKLFMQCQMAKMYFVQKKEIESFVFAKRFSVFFILALFLAIDEVKNDKTAE